MLTFCFPVGLFIVIAAALYLRFSRPHTVPGHKPLTAANATGRAAASDQNKGAVPAPPNPRADSTIPGEQHAAEEGDHGHEAPSAGA